MPVHGMLFSRARVMYSGRKVTGEREKMVLLSKKDCHSSEQKCSKLHTTCLLWKIQIPNLRNTHIV